VPLNVSVEGGGKPPWYKRRAIRIDKADGILRHAFPFQSAPRVSISRHQSPITPSRWKVYRTVTL
jgi:hypothetical protein